MFTELSLGYWSSGHRDLYTYQVSSSIVFFLCQLHVHTCPHYNLLLEVVCCCFPIVLNMTLFIGSQNFISLPSLVFVSAPVSELREWN